jgi:DNA modification methylase
MSSQKGKFRTATQRWAGVGPYYAMFPSAFCDAVIAKYSKKGDAVLDPFAGRGTALYSAAVAGRHALGVELNPVGWIYSRTKLAPADKESVAERIAQLQSAAPRYKKAARKLPRFFHSCYCPDVQRFLLSARNRLNWRQNSTDRTLMAFLLINLHGKLGSTLSNQMRQTKAMSPKYAIEWWKRNGLKAPKIEPVKFLAKRLEWRYAKGIPDATRSNVYLGDSVDVLQELKSQLGARRIRRPSLLLTSPPYFGITNYHYDQWLRLWLLGGPPNDRRTDSQFNGKHMGKFADRSIYGSLLTNVFSRASKLMKPNGTVYVRTDSREPTLSVTKSALKSAFPKHHLKRLNRPIEGKTQTRLFGNTDPRAGEVDLILSV